MEDGDGVVVDVQAAQLESEPLDVNGEQDGAVSGSGEAGKLVHGTLNGKSQSLTACDLARAAI